MVDILEFVVDIALKWSIFHQNPLIEEHGGQWVDIIDHWSIIDHFAKMVDVLEFVVDITLKWSTFHQNNQKRR